VSDGFFAELPMKDGEMRGLVLERFYELRNSGEPVQLPQSVSVAPNDLIQLTNVCDQLAEYGLIEWKPIRSLAGAVAGIGKITARGVDVVDGDIPSPITVTLHDHSVTVSGSTNVQIGNANSIQNIDISKVTEAIDQSTASPEQKAEAKSLWSKLTNNAAFAAIVGAVVTLAGSAR
jgi:hypothetical protein